MVIRSYIIFIIVKILCMPMDHAKKNIYILQINISRPPLSNLQGGGADTIKCPMF